MTKVRFTSPVGRFVQGDLDEPQTKDAQGNLRTVKTGPNAGQPNPQYFIAVAFAKNDPAWPAFWALLVQKAAEDFPNLFPQGAGGACVHPNFAYKVIDGDGPDQNGKLNSTKDGFAGHYVVRFASAYPPRCFYAGRYAANEQIQEKGAIKRGYYVRVSGTVEGNANPQRPGIYVNLDMVELSAYGPEIVSGPDAGEAFGAAPTALPAGASPTPLTPPPTGAPGAPGAPMPAAAPPVPGAPPAPLPVAGPPAAATPYPAAASPAPASPAPYAGYMAPPAAGPAPLGAPAPAASPAPPVPTTLPLPIASPTRVMLPAANGHSYESLIAAGWTDETLRANGMMQ
jgi:hypothetical protein